MSAQPEFRLLLDYENEIARWRRRTSFLLAVILQLLMTILLLLSPRFFRAREKVLEAEVRQEKVAPPTMLYFPRDRLRSLKKPPNTNILSDKNRIAQGKSPKVDKNGLRMPYLRGNTRLPEIAGGGHRPKPPPAPPASRPAAAPRPAPKTMAQANRPASPAPKKKAQDEAQLRLLNVKPPSPVGRPDIHLPESTAGQAIQQSLRAAVQNPGSGGYQGPGDSPDQFQNAVPNFSTAGPVILSDTRGFNFGPYLARVVYVVRRNWYAVIPESARLGEKGRVALVFEIVRDGSVPQLRLLASSGSPALDRAALASIRASNPFPPLPEAFTGKHLVLEFIYFYNMGTGY